LICAARIPLLTDVIVGMEVEKSKEDGMCCEMANERSSSAAVERCLKHYGELLDVCKKVQHTTGQRHENE
jgi:hypothetical protein